MTARAREISFRSASLVAPALALALATSCGGMRRAPSPRVDVAPHGSRATDVPLTLERVGLDPRALDRSVDPCSDFYQFACGGWLSTASIPEGRPAWSTGYYSLVARSEDAVQRILEDSVARAADDASSAKLGNFYTSCLDTDSIETSGTKPIAELLARVRDVKDEASLAHAIASLHLHRIDALFEAQNDQDSHDAAKTIVTLDQSGLGLPDRDYYLEDGSKGMRKTYHSHVSRMFELAGWTPQAARKDASVVIAMETQIAMVSGAAVDRRDATAMDNKVDRAGLKRIAPRFAWDAYFSSLGLPDIDGINVTSVAFFKGLNKLALTTTPTQWQTYLTWRVLRDAASFLPQRFAEEELRMQASLNGQKGQVSRQRRCVSATNQALGELIAERFVTTNFSKAARADVERLVDEVRKRFRHVLKALPWMDDTTRRGALDKLDAMRSLVGYPSEFTHYDFDVQPNRYAANVLAARVFEVRRRLAKIGKPMDRDSWERPPQIADAFYQSQMNQIVLTAAFLQRPFYSERASVPVNFGAIGSMIGHEMSHGFDDSGCDYDAKGNLANWWSDSARNAFAARTHCVEEQYSAYAILPGLKVDGKLTLGENIADIGGVSLAFHAYRAARARSGAARLAEGFDEDQQFFLGYAQAWCMKETEAYASLRGKVDSHSPSRWRVNGPLVNLPEFGEAFKCGEATAMRPKNMCSVW